MRCLATLLFLPLMMLPFGASSLASSLPESKTFIGKPKFQRLIQTANQKNWASLPIGERTARIGQALVGTPYENYTLELDERIEAPSVNMNGMDCWTFFEISLGMARALGQSANPTPQDLLRWIEIDRYRGGKCDGKFSSRLHHLEDWMYDNQRRGLVEDITPRLAGAQRLNREMAYMGRNWKSFRQLRADPSLIPPIQKMEAAISQRGIYYIPKNKVRAIESKLRNGDIIMTVSTWPGTYTNHVGLAYRDSKGVLRFLHASRDKRKVLVDDRLSTYLARNSKQAGILVARPVK